MNTLKFLSMTILSFAIPIASSAESDKKIFNRAIEEILVTAQKRQESAQDIPISISAFSASALDARGVTEIRDLGKITPGLQFSDAVGVTIIFIRGVGTDAWLPTADPSIALYWDGVYIPQTHGVLQEFGGIERVEVLKGPQGTLFGRNSTGGAISIITKTPGLEAETDLELSYGNFDTKRLKAYQSVPVTDNFGLSMALVASEMDFQYTNINPDRDYEAKTAKAGRLKANWQISDSLNLNLTLVELSFEGPGSFVAKNTQPSELGATLGMRATPDDYQSLQDFPAVIDGGQSALYGTLTWSLPWFDLKALSSNQHIGTDQIQYDFDSSEMPIVGFSSPDQTTDQSTAELQIISSQDSWLADKLEWIVGAYYLESSTGYHPVNFHIGTNLLNFFGQAGGTSTPSNTLSPLIQFLPLNTPLDKGFLILLDGEMETESLSTYFQASYSVKDWLEITLGGRYQSETRTVIKSSSGVALSDDTYLPITDFTPRTAKDNNFSPKAVVSLFPADDIMVYLSWTKGYKSATFNIVNLYDEPTYIEPEQVTTYEIGIKSEFFDGLIRANAAVFHTQIEQLQAQFISLFSGGIVQLENAGEAKIQGFEADTLIIPMPHRNPGLSVSANFAYLDAEYTDYQNASGFDPETGFYSQDNDFSGNEIVRSPRLSGGIGITQAIQVFSADEIEFGVDAYYNSGFYYTPQNSTVAEEQTYTLYNARISYLHQHWGLRLTAFGNNFTDERYHIAQFQSDFGNTVTLAYPRLYGLRLNWQF
jgi:iron complex outermembrane receptor protein